MGIGKTEGSCHAPARRTRWLLAYVSIATGLIAEIVATTVTIIILVQVRRSARIILAMHALHRHKSPSFDRKPSRAERRALAADLRLALRQTELMSLFPQVGYGAQRLVAALCRC